jgi:hypothetical protein
MIVGMRRVLLAVATVVALVAVSFGVGWVSSTDDRTDARGQPVVAQLEPLPVPRIVIPNGPWADPRPSTPVPLHVAHRVPRGLLPGLGWLLGLSPESGLQAGRS